MLIEVNSQPPLAKVLGGKQITIELAEGASVDDLLVYLKTHYPGFEARLQAGGDEHGTAYHFFLNRKALRTSELATTHLKAGDRFHILIPLVGGL